MSYNIDKFKLKKVDLTLPKGFDMEAFMEKQSCGWSAPIEVSSNLTDWEFNWGSEGFEMRGIVTADGFKVTDLRCTGESSGHDMDLIIALFEEFKGDLVASRVWEGGDSIDKIIIENGVTREEEVEI